MTARPADRVARGAGSFRVRWVTYAGLGGYAAAALLGTVSGGNTGAIAVAALLFGALVFWLGRRSAMETASAEATAWAVSVATANATSSSLAAVQLHLDVDNRRVVLSDPTGLHVREVDLDDRSLPSAGIPHTFPLAASTSARVAAVKAQRFTDALQREGLNAGAASTFLDLDGDHDAATMTARDGAGTHSHRMTARHADSSGIPGVPIT